MGSSRNQGGHTPESSKEASAQPKPQMSKDPASGRKRVKSPEVFLLDGDRAEASLIQLALEREGIQCKAFIHARECLNSLLKCACDVLVVDLAIQDIDGIQVVVEATSICPGLPVVVITDPGNIERAELAMKMGAMHFVERLSDGVGTIDPGRSAMTTSTRSEGQDSGSQGGPVGKRHFMAGGKRNVLAKPSKVFVLDKDAAEVEAIRLALEGDEFACRTFTQPLACIEGIEKNGCDILLCSMVMPEMDGYQVLAEVKGMCPDLPVICISGHMNIQMAMTVMKNGAADAIEKPWDRTALIQSIKSALTNANKNWSEVPARLSKTEKLVLEHILKGNGNRHIAQELDKSVRTIEDYRRSLMKKMGADSIVDLVKRCMDLDAAKGGSSHAVRRLEVGDVVDLVKRCIASGTPGETTRQKWVTRKSTTWRVKVPGSKTFRTYNQALKYLLDRTDYERGLKLRYSANTFSLDRMRNLLSLLGDPHLKIKTAHVAGTNGKSSTCTMLGKMLEANSYKVGLYTSPHVMSLHERIQVNSRMITQSEMLGLINQAYAAVEKLARTDCPTFFEIMTTLAFMHFRESQVDIAVIETGLGGRLDCTNVIQPSVIGIASISMDHMQQLGDTIEKIAAETAGIFKKYVPAVSVEQDPKVVKVLKTHASLKATPLSVTGQDIAFSYRFEFSKEHGPHNRICITTDTSKFDRLRVPLPGEHQAINCGLAIAMLDKLKGAGYEIDDQKAIEGLHSVQLLGRMEQICNDPRIIVDAASNAASIRAVMQAIGQHVPYDSMMVIFGCNADKDVAGMLRELQYGADKVIFTRNNSARSIYPQDLAEMYTEICGKTCHVEPSLRQALQTAYSAVGREDLICITGSFYLVGQAKRFLEEGRA
jgi:dihydrofolate synthase / folylpolyglutamate synthase